MASFSWNDSCFNKVLIMTQGTPMKYLLSVFLLTIMLLVTTAAQADHRDRIGPECPSSIQYSNGQYLKSGSTYYYSTGQYLRAGSKLYYVNGQYLKTGSNIYYQSGQYLKAGNNIYYPNGQYLKAGSNYYYSNGQYFKAGYNYYYKNGQYAKVGGRLYRPDGSTSAFPVTIEEDIGAVGHLKGYLTTSDDNVHLELNNLSTSSQFVEIKGIWEGTILNKFDIHISTGVRNEDLLLRVDGSSVKCNLLIPGPGPGPGPGPDPIDREFTIRSEAANVRVVVKDGYSVREVREALQHALDDLN
jgi:hypothetical protein